MGEQVAAGFFLVKNDPMPDGFPAGRGCSSVGRAPALQAGGQGFESPHLHSGPVRIPVSYLENCISRERHQISNAW